MRPISVFQDSKTRPILRWSTLCATVLYLLCSSAPAWSFSFDHGTRGGWTYELFNSSDTSVLSSGSAPWDGGLNCPILTYDSPDDHRGSIKLLVSSADYSAADYGDYLVVRFVSRDLRGSPNWQTATSFTAQLLPANVAEELWVPDVLGRLEIVVYDRDEAREKILYSDLGTLIDTPGWAAQELDISATLAGADPPVSDYQIRQVRVTFFILVEEGRYITEIMAFSVDEVVPCNCHIFDDRDSFRDAADSWTRYGFRYHDLSGDLSDLPASPVDASDFDDHFDIGYSNLDAFNVLEESDGPCTLGGSRSLFTHSVGSADNYTLTFSNFEGRDSPVTAFGVTVCDFASHMSTPASITFDTGTSSGTLLTVPGGQPSYTQNFVGIVVDPEDAFTSITLTFDDNESGSQRFDIVHYTPDSW